MTIKIGVVMDPIDKITYKKDSTLAMLWEVQRRGWSLFYMEQGDLFVNEGKPYAECQSLKTFQNPEKWFELGEDQVVPLSELDVILMRKDPPFDLNFIYTTYILEKAELEGVLIVNKPQSLRDCNEKMFATQFPQCCTPTMVSSQQDLLVDFLQQHKDVIYKPLDGMGGSSIFHVKLGDKNTNVIIETLTQMGQRPIMAQRYIPEITAGDKRIILVDGEPIPYCLARIPMAGESRGNLAAGGTGEARPLTDRDRWICEQVAPTLKEKGLLFVGIDVIGEYLTEINVTSPTCIREIDAAYETNIAGVLMDAIETRLSRN